MNPYTSTTTSSYPLPPRAASARDPANPLPRVDNFVVPDQWTTTVGAVGADEPANNAYDFNSEDNVQPVAKKRKLDVSNDVSDAVDGGNVQLSIPAQGVNNTAPSGPSARPAWSFGNECPLAYDAQGGVSTKSLEEDQQQPSASLPPFPARPWSRGCRRHIPATGSPHRTGTPVNNVQLTPYTLETPTEAPVFGSNKSGDFYPWRGTHPEDSLTEQTAKQGYFDHVQVSQNESNTARPSVYAHLKHRSGLKILSSVFAVALEKSQARAKVSTSSTFKPPPRVTLTDMKREAWLRDLANPTVPLRKLSRTIPHGIRGKGLLDQCLNKNIPTGRALWLAKCVGANEIRAFKRKGTSPAAATGLESKWVRDWTVNVIQFLESVIGGCGVEGWRNHLNYSMNLTSRFFRDNLLDQDYFLEWLLSSLEAAPTDTLPVWLLIVRLYWPSLVRYRKRGRRLAEGLLEKLHVTVAADSDGSLRPLCQRLSCLVNGLVLSKPSCFVLPKTWCKYENALSSSLGLDKPHIRSFLANLSDRNSRVGISKKGSRNPQRFPSRQLIHRLDAAVPNYRAELASECLDLQLDHSTLVSTALQWASTSFRNGLARVFVAAKLLRSWNRLGIDTDAHILTFLEHVQRIPGTIYANVYHVISELVQSRSFSTGRFLQRLMARGAVAKSANQEHVPGDVELLAHIPSKRLPDHVWNLRNTLLERAGSSVASENRLIDNLKSHIHCQMPELCTTAETSMDVAMTEEVDFTSLTWTVRSEISQFLRDTVAAQFDGKSVAGKSTVTLGQFCQVRHMLESLEDLSALADILQHTSRSDHTDILVAAVDTINRHFDSLSAIGCTAGLFKSYFAAYTRISRSQVPTLELTSSLLEIGFKLPGEISSVTALRRDMARLDRKSGIAAFSPASDHMTDTLNPINASFPESLDQVLSSGNNIDEPTTIRMFDALMQMLSSNRLPDSKLTPSGMAKYLTRLRAVNPKLFDGLMVKWVTAAITAQSQGRPSLSVFLPPLIGVGCITFHAFLALVQKLARAGPSEEAIPEVAALRSEILRLLAPQPSTDQALLDTVLYRYRTIREEFLLHHWESLLGFISDTLAGTPSSETNPTHDSDQKDVFTTCVVPLISEVIVKSSGRSDREPASLILRDYPSCKEALRCASALLLGLQSHDGIAAAQETLQRIDDFSLPCGLVKLQLLCETESDDSTRRGVLDMVLKAAETDIKAGTHRWIDLMSILQTHAAQQVRQRAEQALLALVPTKQTQMNPAEQQANDSPERDGLAYLSVIEELGWTLKDDETASLSSELFEKLGTLLQVVGLVQNSADTLGKNNSVSETTADRSSCSGKNPGRILFWFYALLRLVAMHRSTFSAANASKADVSDQCRLLLVVCCISLSPLFGDRLDQPCGMIPGSVPMPSSTLGQILPSTPRHLRIYALDVASILVDTLSDESRHNCALFLRERCGPNFHPANNPALLHIFGPLPEPKPLLSTHPDAGVNSNSPATAPIQTVHFPATQQTSTQQPQTQTQSGSNSNINNNTAPSGTSAVTTTTTIEDPASLTYKLRLQQGGRVIGICPSRPWEMLEDAAPVLGENDTALNLAYFGTMQARR